MGTDAHMRRAPVATALPIQAIRGAHGRVDQIKCPRTDTHLTYMIDIALTTEFLVCRWRCAMSSGDRVIRWSTALALTGRRPTRGRMLAPGESVRRDIAILVGR